MKAIHVIAINDDIDDYRISPKRFSSAAIVGGYRAILTTKKLEIPKHSKILRC